MLRDLPSEMKMNILGYAPYRSKNTIAATIAIEDETLLEELMDIDPDFSLAVLLSIYEEQPEFSLGYIMNLIDKKKSIMANAPDVIELYNIIGLSFIISDSGTIGERREALYSLKVGHLADINATLELLENWSKSNSDIHIINVVLSLYYNTIRFDAYGAGLGENLIMWDKLMNSGNLLDIPIGNEYKSLRFN